MIKNVSRPENEPLSRYRNLILDEECVGGIFQLTTKEDALFAGVNVKADKINFDIGRDLSIISLQDEYKSDGKNWGVGLNVSGKILGTEKQGGYARPTGSVNYGENHQDSKWTGNPLGIFLVAPKALDYLGGSIYSFESGDIKGGVENLASLAALGITTGVSYQIGNGGLSQTTTSNKGMTPEKYYNIKNNVGMTPEVVEVVNKNYGTNYIPTVVQENKKLYNNGGQLQTPYNKARENPVLIDGKYKDVETNYTIKGHYTYVIDSEGNLQMAKTSKLGMEGGHTSLSGGKPVIYAGQMKFNNKGQLEYWNNGSGHYEPSATQAAEISKIFKSLGIPDANIEKFVPVIIEPR